MHRHSPPANLGEPSDIVHCLTHPPRRTWAIEETFHPLIPRRTWELDESFCYEPPVDLGIVGERGGSDILLMAEAIVVSRAMPRTCQPQNGDVAVCQAYDRDLMHLYIRMHQREAYLREPQLPRQ